MRHLKFLKTLINITVMPAVRGGSQSSACTIVTFFCVTMVSSCKLQIDPYQTPGARPIRPYLRRFRRVRMVRLFRVQSFFFVIGSLWVRTLAMGSHPVLVSGRSLSTRHVTKMRAAAGRSVRSLGFPVHAC